ncbi:acyl carrier protein [Actinoplanes sp. RD1]|uniref:acyl carrier protein n=1 Tax=Actinoplanes sp. RD1 TaxID=3064538 RepID=UPI00274062A8|nr:phosphopantetheine-binding protein [Actinoplanes sp. RD1]
MPLPPGTSREELEARLIELWSAKLGGVPVGRDDNFFELGGDSLTAADLLMDVYVQLHAEVDAWVLFLRPTVAELADAILQPDLVPQPE